MYGLNQLSFRVNAQSNLPLSLTFNIESTPAVPKATLTSGVNNGAIFRFAQTNFALPVVLNSDRTRVWGIRVLGQALL
jgi:hypothetical protein